MMIHPERHSAPKTLQKESAERLAVWADGLEALWGAHAQFGYGMPKVDLTFIESVRSRTPKERKYGYYLQEVLKESFFLPGGTWTAQLRLNCVPSFRSAYLDYLQSAIERGELGLPSTEVIHSSLDPNYIIYSTLKTRELPLWRNHLDAIQKAKEQDLVNLAAQIDAIALDAGDTFTTKTVTDLLLAIAKDLSLDHQLVERGKNPRVVLRGEIVQGISMYLEWSELRQLQKWGNLQLSFVMQESAQELWSPSDSISVPFRTSLGGLVPGGDWYAWNNKNLKSVALALLAHVQFLRMCTRMDSH